MKKEAKEYVKREDYKVIELEEQEMQVQADDIQVVGMQVVDMPVAGIPAADIQADDMLVVDLQVECYTYVDDEEIGEQKVEGVEKVGKTDEQNLDECEVGLGVVDPTEH